MRAGPQPVKIAYKVPGPREYLMLEVRRSANGWWMDKEKVFTLLRCFNQMMALSDACIMAGITLREYRYFAKLHPVIEERRELPYLIISMKAKMALVKKVYAGDIKACWKWLEMTEPEIFSLRHHRSALGDLRRRAGLRAIKSNAGDLRVEYELIKNGIETLKKELCLPA